MNFKDPNTYEVLWDEKVLGEEPKENIPKDMESYNKSK